MDDRRLLYELAAAHDKSRAAAEFAALPAARRDELLVKADDEEVLLPAGRALAELTPQALTEAWRSELHGRFRMRDELTPESRGMSRELAAREVEHCFIKGPATERAYGGGVRQYDDLDIVLPTIADFWTAALALELVDYRIDSLVIAREPGEEGLLGVASLSRPSLLLPGARCEAEFQFGAVSIHWRSWLRLGDGFWRSRRLLDGDSGPPVPSPGYAALIFLVEMIDRIGVTVRDRLDAQAMIRELAPADSEWLREQAQDLALESELRVLENVRERGAAPPPWSRVRAASQRVAPGVRPFSRAVTHDWPHVRRRRGRRAALEASLVCLAGDAASSLLDVRRFVGPIAAIDRRIDARAWLAAGRMPVHFVPVDPADRDSMCWRDDGLLATPAGLFVPAVFPALTRDEYTTRASAAVAA
jgi:hypothetical protein